MLPKPFAAPAGATCWVTSGDSSGPSQHSSRSSGDLLLFGVDLHRAYLDVLLAGKGWGDGDPTRLPYHARPYYRLPEIAPLIRGLLLGVAVALLAARVDEVARHSYSSVSS